ncbi:MULTISPECIES: hypothetical protein [unclassified Sphingobium]|uniref:hypothetical protein n=1 Tax=unclassified Sphingobium TaxID=2611147 RepID=UPI001E2E0E35|nr:MULTISPECIES: hypothetical protein [unclassified Sphingobium]GLI99754.1 hypothetical protein Sbs19_35720 [Sphingobium sp. BS19]CAH0356740.1 hypothetical protein SPH9361_04383 [Sphingobium sp. CECT 9361]|tara:strand:- start:1130 stop:1639 length:510 start_codon:yes stop_codon:yes gene_type:complete
MIRLPMSALIVPLVLLAACDSKDDGKPGTDISIRDDEGNVVAAANGKDGKMSIQIPGLDAKIALPKIRLDSDNFDIDGVKLYPGSSIRSINVNAGKTEDTGRVSLTFTAPASPDSVREYFVNALKEEGLSVAADGNLLTGTQKDGDPFRIDLKPAAANTTQGAITLSAK